MKISISFEKTVTSDVSVMVDALRASSTITAALDYFDEIIPCFTSEEAFEIAKKTGGVLAGERGGVTLEKFDVGNSPTEIKNFRGKTLILTTTNGTRILESMDSTVLVGCFLNAEAVARKAVELSEEEIDLVMAGVKGKFATEDFLASSEIVYWILKELKSLKIKYELNDLAVSGLLAIRDEKEVNKSILKSSSAKRLTDIGYREDVRYCLNRNITDNVAIFDNNKLVRCR